MAKYDNTKFYWLQLKEDFFDQDAIDWLEDQPNGEKYSLFYLKLCLKSLRTNGILIRQVGTMLVPYDYSKLAELTKTDTDTVIVAMELLTRIGLVQVVENGKIYLTQVEDMIGSQSKGAFKKQQQRIGVNLTKLVGGGQKGDKCPPKIEKEKELELELNNKSVVLQKEIFDYWNSKEIVVHKTLTETFIKAIDKALKKYSVEEIKTYIDRYNTVLKDTTYFFDTKWTIDKFLTQSNAIADFTDEGSKWLSYLNRQEKTTQPKTQHFENEREYSKEELNSFLTDIDDIDL